MKAFLTSCLFLVVLSLSAQEHPDKATKGIKPIATNEKSAGQTYAVVVGISDYQDEGIPDLRFADKDAGAFAGFLQSPSGGSLDEDHLKVLLNEQATVAQFAMQLDWLWEVVQENDRVIIYFSGHGDVEKKSITQPGYLLCWDAPARVYLAGGAMNVRDLNDVISTLSIQNKAKVILITDACRAGKLSGSGIGGSQATAANLAKQYANEIKILSCQPDEYSIEGEQWGGGRGAFSYHLLDGLYGLADGDGDLNVNLKEISRYLEDRVSEEVAPHAQNPMTVGSKMENLIDVLPEALEQLKEGRKGQLQIFSGTDSRGIEDDVLLKADTNVVEMYLAFKESLSNQNFLEPKDSCTDYYYSILTEEVQLKRLHSSMRRNYAAALQDDAQQVMNTMLKSGLTERILKNNSFSDIYYNYPVYLQRAGELLGKYHYMYETLQARKYFFEGLIKEKKSDKRSSFLKALSWQPNMPHALVKLIEFSEVDQLDSAAYFFQKSSELIPSWVEPYIAMSRFYRGTLENEDKDEKMLNLAGQIDTNSVLVWYQKAIFYAQVKKDYSLAEYWYLKVIDVVGEDICFPCAHNNLGAVYRELGHDTKAEEYFKKAIELDFKFVKAYRNLGSLNLDSGQLKEAGEYFKKCIELDSTNWMFYTTLGGIYQSLERWEESAIIILKAIELAPPIWELRAMLGNSYTHIPGKMDAAMIEFNKVLKNAPESPDTYLYLVEWCIINDNIEDAWLYLELGLEKGKGAGMGETMFLDLREQRDFHEMQKDLKWGALMEKYFPEQFKKH